MKSGTPSNNLKLYDRTGHEVTMTDLPEDFQAEFQERWMSSEDRALEAKSRTKTQWIALLTVSIVCSVAAVTTGICAALLVRKKETVDGLTDVRDILQECQSRMKRLETDLAQFSPAQN